MNTDIILEYLKHLWDNPQEREKRNQELCLNYNLIRYGVGLDRFNRQSQITQRGQNRNYRR
jgi:hypothetical protein